MILQFFVQILTLEFGMDVTNLGITQIDGVYKPKDIIMYVPRHSSSDTDLSTNPLLTLGACTRVTVVVLCVCVCHQTTCYIPRLQVSSVLLHGSL